MSIRESVRDGLQQLDSEELSFVREWLVRTEGWTAEEAEASEREFKRFVALSYGSEGWLREMPLVVPERADGFLHAFLQFNGEYLSWCRQHFGEDVVLHLPGRAHPDGWATTLRAMMNVHGTQCLAYGSSSVRIGRPDDDFDDDLLEIWPNPIFLDPC